MNATDEPRAELGDAVLVRLRKGKQFGVISMLIYTPFDEAPRPCRRVRWANIRNGLAIAVLTDGRKVWKNQIDPIPTDGLRPTVVIS